MLEFYLGMVVCKFGIYVVFLVFDGVCEEDVWVIIEEVGMFCDVKIVLYDGWIGELFDNCVLVGIMYMIKFVYMVDDKFYVCFIGLYLFVI